eukprot:scaffold3144_cov260-Pinguiococcus_pyrenoidosus.AAC.1
MPSKAEPLSRSECSSHEAVVLATSPGCTESFRGYLAYMFCPAEPAFDATTKRLAKVTASAALTQLVHFVYTILVMGLLLDFGYDSGYQPFEGSFFNHAYVGLLIFNMVEHGFSLGALITMLMGYQPTPIMDIPAPAFKARSIREFWGKRYNLAISRMLRRPWMDTLFRQEYEEGLTKEQKAARQQRIRILGPFSVFLASGVIHELMHPVCLKRAYPGEATIFFMLQFALCVVETKVLKLMGGAVVPTHEGRGIVGQLRWFASSSVGMAWTCAALTVTAPWFTRGYLDSKFFMIYAHVYPRFRLHFELDCADVDPAFAGTCS